MASSFFKIYFDPSAPHLSWPPDFVLNNKIPKDPVIRSTNGGYCWKLKTKQIGDSYGFADGWNRVVKDTQLGFGDFLYFILVDQSTFKMTIFSPNGCEKILPPKTELHHDDEDDEEIDAGEIEDDNEEVDTGEIEDDNESSDNNEENNDDDPLYVPVDDDEEKNEDDPLSVPVDDDEENNDDDPLSESIDNDEEKNEDDPLFVSIDKDEEKNKDDPLFVSVITTAHKKCLRLPGEFSELLGIDAEGSMTVKNLDGKEYVMGMKLDRSFRIMKRYLLQSGWPRFRKENGLFEGDKCVFKFIRSEGKLSLVKVTGKKCPARKRQPHGGDENVSPVEEVREKPPKRTCRRPPE